MKKKELLEELEHLKINNDNLCMEQITFEHRIEDLEKENEKLKQELADCVASNELLDRENNKLREQLEETRDNVKTFFLLADSPEEICDWIYNNFVKEK